MTLEERIADAREETTIENARALMASLGMGAESVADALGLEGDARARVLEALGGE